MTSLSPRRRWISIAFGVVGLAFVAFALWQTWGDSQEQVMPPTPSIVVAGAFVLVGLVGSGLSWVALFPPPAPSRLVADFYLAQLGKYIPGGGIWQVAGQVGLSTARGVAPMRVVGNVAVHAVIQLTAAAVLGSLLVFSTDLPGWIRALCGLGIASPVLLHRAWMAAALGWLGKRLGPRIADADPPPQPLILRSWFWTLMPISGFAVAYGIMVSALDPSVGVWKAGSSFALAWAIGFVMLPFPAGLGVREAALVALVGASVPVVVATSLVLRLLAIVGDVTLMAATRRMQT